MKIVHDVLCFLKDYLLSEGFDSSMLNPGNYTHIEQQVKNWRRETPDIKTNSFFGKEGIIETYHMVSLEFITISFVIG